MMGWYHGDAGWGSWLVMALAMVAFWGLVVFFVVAVFRDTKDPGDRSDAGPRRNPLEILDERFARGEIEADEYHARQDVLRPAHH